MNIDLITTERRFFGTPVAPKRASPLESSGAVRIGHLQPERPRNVRSPLVLQRPALNQRRRNRSGQDWLPRACAGNPRGVRDDGRRTPRWMGRLVYEDEERAHIGRPSSDRSEFLHVFHEGCQISRVRRWHSLQLYDYGCLICTEGALRIREAKFNAQLGLRRRVEYDDVTRTRLPRAYGQLHLRVDEAASGSGAIDGCSTVRTHLIQTDGVKRVGIQSSTQIHRKLGDEIGLKDVPERRSRVPLEQLRNGFTNDGQDHSRLDIAVRQRSEGVRHGFDAARGRETHLRSTFKRRAAQAAAEME